MSVLAPNFDPLWRKNNIIWCVCYIINYKLKKEIRENGQKIPQPIAEFSTTYSDFTEKMAKRLPNLFNYILRLYKSPIIPLDYVKV